MLDYIRYDQKYDVVMRTLFANAVFAKTIIAGQRVAKTERFDCVTLEGWFLIPEAS
jgi:chromosome segregation ATPase